jgi:hypothetical protein
MPGLDVLPRLAEFSVGAARQAGSLALSLARTVAAPVLGRRSAHDATGWTRNYEPPTDRPVDEPPPAPAPGAPRTNGLADPPPAAPARAARPRPVQPVPAPEPAVAVAPEPDPEPAHVDREAVVVAEFADAEAADGAGAQLRVDEPWSGYDSLNAKDVVAQLATADGATLAVVRLYETSHRNRRSVLAEIDRRLAANG